MKMLQFTVVFNFTIEKLITCQKILQYYKKRLKDKYQFQFSHFTAGVTPAKCYAEVS